MDEKLDLNTLCIVCGSENTDEDEGMDWLDKYFDERDVALWCIDCDKFTTIVTYEPPSVNSKRAFTKED